MSHNLFAGASLCALAFFPSAARAEAVPAQEVIVVHGLPNTKVEAEGRPGGTDVVTAAEYEDKVAVSLRDALAFSPGIYAQPRFGQEVRLSIRGSGISRGFHMRGLTLLQDGVPINLADDNGDFQELDPLIFEQIQVYRGANGLRFGGSTLGGAINVITPTGGSASGVALRIDGGSFDTLRGKAAYGLSGNDMDLWLSLTGDRSDGDRKHSGRRGLRFNSNAGFRLSENVQTRFYLSGQTLRQRLPGSLDLATALNAPKSGNFAGDQQRNIDSIRVQNRTQITLGAAKIEVGAFANFKKLFHPIFQVVDQKSTDWGIFSRFEWGRGPFELIVGSTARFGTVDALRYVNIGGHRGARTFAADQAANTVDIYGEGRYRVGKLDLIAGGIYVHGERKQAQTFPISVKNRAAFDSFSPRLGLLWQPRDELAFYANYSRSFEMPGFIELAQTAAFVPLDAQRAWTAEIGARGRIGIAHVDISLYRARLRGELLQFSVGPDIPAPTFNADRTLHQGIEAGLDLDLAPWARLRQVYQYNDFRFRDDPQYGDNRLPVVPTHLYRAEIRIGTDALHVAPRIEWIPRGAWADYTNNLRVEGYFVTGASAEARIRAGWTFFLDARNLTGAKGIGDISALVSATPASFIFSPIERRALYGGVRAHF